MLTEELLTIVGGTVKDGATGTVALTSPITDAADGPTIFTARSL